MDAQRISLQNWPLPDRSKDVSSSQISCPRDQVLYDLNVLTFAGEDQGKFIVGRLEDAEGRIVCTIDDLNIFQTRFP